MKHNAKSLAGKPLTKVRLNGDEFVKTLLPRTSTTSGDDKWFLYRAGKPRPLELIDPEDNTAVILEIGEVEATGETGEGAAEISALDLRQRASQAAGIQLLVKHWPAPNKRHAATQALAGALLRNGVELKVVEQYVRVVAHAVGDEAVHERLKAVGETDQRLESEETAYGFPMLAKLVGEEVTETALHWLQNHSEHEEQFSIGDEQEGVTIALADGILASDHFAKDAGAKIYVYRDGVYQPRGEDHIKRRVKRLLENADASSFWSRYQAEEVVGYIRVDVPELLLEPPTETINVKNGLLDIATGRLRPHNPSFLSPIQIPIRFDPTARCAEIDIFLAQVFPRGCRDLPWEILGDALTPDRSIQKAILLLGEGGNGKGVFLALLSNFVGQRNISAVSLQKLESDRFAVARVYGKLANICADLPSQHLVGTSVFKSITGNDIITGEYKFKDSFEFKPYCRLLFSANHLPQSKDASKAFYDRWLVVPFDSTFRGTSREIPRKELDAKLSTPEELSGALNKALAALRRVREQNRFAETEATKAALAEFRAVTDPLAVWLDRTTVMDPKAHISKEELLMSYNEACEQEGRPVMTAQGFGRRVKKLRPSIREGQREVDGKTKWCHLGIGFRKQESRESRDSPLLANRTGDIGSERGQKEAGGGEQVKGNRVNRVNGVNGKSAC